MTDHHDEIDFEPPTYTNCECCGATTTSLTRFVTREGDAFAVYFARFSNSDHGRHVSVLAGFGPWYEGAPQEDRTALACQLWVRGDRFQVSLVDGKDDGWDTDFLGRKLSREEALESDWKQELFDLTDHIVECDRPIIEHLEANAGAWE